MKTVNLYQGRTACRNSLIVIYNIGLWIHFFSVHFYKSSSRISTGAFLVLGRTPRFRWSRKAQLVEGHTRNGINLRKCYT